MPRWPGPLLGIGGAILAIGALGAGALAARGDLAIEDRTPLGWLALLGVALFAAGLVYSAVRQLRIRRHLPPERYRGPSVLILLALVFVIASIATAPFGADATALILGTGQMTFVGSLVILVATQAALLVVTWLFVTRPNALAALPSLGANEPARAILAGLGWGALAWLGATLVSGLAVLVLEAVGIEPEPQAAERAIALVEPWLVVLAVAVLAPIAEEVFFRGVVFNAWLREHGRRWAYAGSAALFAAIHISLVSLVPIFLLGLALAWAYERTRNLLTPIVMHATVNGISVAIALLVRFDVIVLPGIE